MMLFLVFYFNESQWKRTNVVSFGAYLGYCHVVWSKPKRLDLQVKSVSRLGSNVICSEVHIINIRCSEKA